MTKDYHISTGLPSKSKFRGLIDFLKRPPKWSLWSVVMIGIVSGVLFLAGVNTAMEATDSVAFCTSCHSMRDTVFEEYKTTTHYQNRTGVQATCPDCHVPKDWMHKVARKFKATGELYGEIIGNINTKEKFEAKRMELATNEWNQMKASGSRECLNCHSFAAMEQAKQKPRAQTSHATAQKDGKTCIDCHKGIAHMLPKEYTADE